MIGLIARHADLSSAPFNFHKWRAESLQDLNDFLPHNKRVNDANPPSSVPNWKVLLAELKNGSDMPIGHLVSTRHPCFYIRIPKAASTSISFSVLKQNLAGLSAQELTDTQISFLADAWTQHNLDALHGLTGFAVVRNPFHRLVSVYRDLFENPNTPFIYQNYLGGILPKNLSFEEFVKRLAKIPDRWKDQHVKPQYRFIEAYRYAGLPVVTLRLEDTVMVENYLGQYQLDVPHRHDSTAYDHRSYYTKETEKLVRKMYSYDFELFEYEQNLAG